MIFRSKKKKQYISLISFSIKNISTGMIGYYIVNKLYKKEGFMHIGYNLINIDGCLRCELTTISDNGYIKQYFKDRCPGMIEDEVLKYCKESKFHTVEWDNGFFEVVEGDE